MTRTRRMLGMFGLGGVLVAAALYLASKAEDDAASEAWRGRELARVEASLHATAAPLHELIGYVSEALEEEPEARPMPAFWARLQGRLAEPGMPTATQVELFRPNARSKTGATFLGRVSRQGLAADQPALLVRAILQPEAAALQAGPGHEPDSEHEERGLEESSPPERMVWFSGEGAQASLHLLQSVELEIEQDIEDEEDDEEEDDDEDDDDDELIEIRLFLLHIVSPVTSPPQAGILLRCDERERELARSLVSVVAPGGIQLTTAAGPSVPIEGEDLEGRRPTSTEGPRAAALLAPAPTGSRLPGLVGMLGLALCLGALFMGRRAVTPLDASGSDLTSEAAHEMRTPLTVIRGKLEVALRQDREPVYYRQVLDACLEEVDGLERLQDAILLLTRTKQGDLADESMDIRALVQAEVSRVVDDHPERRVEFRSIVDGPAHVEGDPSLLARAIGNLLDNAASHSVEGGAIVAEVRLDGALLRIQVDDEGPGIPPERHETIFQRFYRGPEVGRRGIAGCGLGLPLVRRIAELHGGTAAVGNRPGGGRFVITLPRAEASREV